MLADADRKTDLRDRHVSDMGQLYEKRVEIVKDLPPF